MKYSYLQNGGVVEQITQLVQAAINGDQEANNTIQQIMQAAKSGDQQAQQIVTMIQKITTDLQNNQGIAVQKCGGKMKKKKVKKISKGGCPCMLKKVGGKLIEVDSCTNLPIDDEFPLEKIIKNFFSMDKESETPGKIKYIIDDKGNIIDVQGKNFENKNKKESSFKDKLDDETLSYAIYLS